MNKDNFYKSIRKDLFGGALSVKQFQGVEAIITEYNRICLNDLRKLAYVFATVYHETGRTMQPEDEIGRGKGKDYGKKLKRGNGPGKRIPYTTPDQLYYGRGLVQLTWYENYEALGKIVGKDLLNQPSLMLDVDVSIQVLFKGMISGYFTGRKLSHFINESETDYINSRRIINGTDCAEQIAGYADKFYRALIQK